MPKAIDRKDVKRMLEQGAQLLEVLPEHEYEEEHLPGAANIPLKRLDRDTASSLDRNRPVIVYCWDSRCDLSPRAAWRLEGLGFSEVYDYVAGKAEWMGAGLEVEGSKAGSPRAGDVARRDVPTCALDEQIGEVAERVRRARWATCIVVNDQQIVLGRLRKNALASDPSQAVEAVMQLGPSTIRPDTTLESAIKRIDESGDGLLVTTLDGRLVGVLYREDAAPAVRP